MAKFRPMLLVVDASLARAAGDASLHPTSARSRETLECIRDHHHKMALTSAIRTEWDRHQSGFARRWRLSMMARKQIVPLNEGELTDLGPRILKATADPPIREIILKDKHLLEAALIADKRVVSNDDRVRNQIRAHIHALPEVHAVLWGNPCIESERVTEWLGLGAPNDRHRRLDHHDSQATP